MLRKLGLLSLAEEAKGKSHRCLKLPDGSSRDDRSKLSVVILALHIPIGHQEGSATLEQLTREMAVESILADFKCSVTQSCN